MRQWSINRKLGVGFSGLVFCVLALGALSLWAVNSFRDELDNMNAKILRKAELSGSILVSSRTVRADIRGMLLGAATNRPQDFQKYRSASDADFSKLEGYLIDIRPLLIDPRGKVAVDTIAAVLPPFRDSFREIADLAAAGKVELANKIRLEKQTPMADQIDQSSVELRTIQREVADATVKGANERVTVSRWSVIAGIAVGLALGVLVFGMVRNLVAMLRHTVKDLSAGGEQVSAASGQIAATSQSLSQGASEQAASIEEISASMEEMTAMTKRNSDSSSEATAMMTETVKQVERSNAALADMVASMSSIKSSSEKVAKINKTIDEIAFQTNILALNAAVEAARAGEAGMGFAVVADEVRNLAQRSAVAAKDTAALIEESIANANQGTDRLELVSAAIRGITDGAGKVKNLLDEVNESSKQQGQGIQQVSTAISQVSTVTQTAAASAEESAAASEELNAQSQTVQDLVHTLAVVVEGGSGADEQEAPRSASLHAPRRSGSRASSSLSSGGRGGNHGGGNHQTQHRLLSKGDDPFPMEPVESGSFREF